jgi:hypothetical protein
MIKTECLRILKAFKDVEEVDFNQLENFVFDEIKEVEVDCSQLECFALNEIEKIEIEVFN